MLCYGQERNQRSHGKDKAPTVRVIVGSLWGHFVAVEKEDGAMFFFNYVFSELVFLGMSSNWTRKTAPSPNHRDLRV